MMLIMQDMPNVMQQIWQVYNASMQDASVIQNMDQFDNGINILQSLMEQPYNEHEASMQWDLEVIKV